MSSAASPSVAAPVHGAHRDDYRVAWNWDLEGEELDLALRLLTQPGTPERILNHLPEHVVLLQAAMEMDTFPRGYRKTAFDSLHCGPGRWAAPRRLDTWWAWADAVSRSDWLTPTRFNKLVRAAAYDPHHYDVTLPLLATHKHFGIASVAAVMTATRYASENSESSPHTPDGNRDWAAHQALAMFARGGPGWALYTRAIGAGLGCIEENDPWRTTHILGLIDTLRGCSAPTLETFMLMAENRDNLVDVHGVELTWRKLLDTAALVALTPRRPQARIRLEKPTHTPRS